MRTKNKSARSRTSGESGRSSDSKPIVAEPKPPCGAPLKSKKGGFCSKPAVKGGRCRYHIVEKELAADLETLRLLQDAAERHAFSADQAMEEGGNGAKDATFNRNARTAAALVKARQDLRRRAAKTEDGEPAADEGTNIVIVDNQRGDNPKPESGPQPEPQPGPDAARPDAGSAVTPQQAADATEPDPN